MGKHTRTWGSWIAATVLALAGGLAIGGDVAAQQGPQTERVLIRFRGLPTAADQALVRGAGGQVHHAFTIVPVIAATVPAAALTGLQHNPRVELIEIDGLFFANDTELDNAWGVGHIGAGTVHGGGVTGSGVNVAVLDTGIDYDHPDLSGNYAGGWDFVNNDNDPKDDHGHGTHCAGTIAAADDDSGVVGVAPGANIYALKVLGADGSGNYSNMIAALQWCTNNGIHVTSNSYGGSTDPGTSVRQAFEAAEAAGIVNVVSAGNSGNPKGKGDKVGYPAKYDACIAVAATDDQNRRASFSSTGPTVEIAAPGVAVNSTVPSFVSSTGYAAWNGTSMACPHVAGVVALMIDKGIADSNGNGRISDEIRAGLQSTATDLGDPGRDPHFGFGLVNAVGATSLNQAPSVIINSPSNGAAVPNGTQVTFQGGASDVEDGDLSASISWSSDHDGALGTGASVVATLSSDRIHTITASVTDSATTTSTAVITVVVGNVNLPPVVTITAPGSGSSFVQGTPVGFTGTATDAEDGDLTGVIVWSSTLDGYIGTGGAVSSSTLSLGTHTITASATDNGLATTVATIALTITSSAPPALTVTVTTDLPSYPAGTKKAYITAHVTSGGSPVMGASASVVITTAGGTTLSASGTTDANGDLRVSYRINRGRDGVGTYTASADASKSGYTAGSGSTTFEIE
ncbi:MAG: S8 family peptidase [Planctomycetota bacterium]|jgi:subtilisin